MNINEIAALINHQYPNLRNEPWSTPELVRIVLHAALEIYDQPATDPDDLPVRLVSDEELR